MTKRLAYVVALLALLCTKAKATVHFVYVNHRTKQYVVLQEGGLVDFHAPLGYVSMGEGDDRLDNIIANGYTEAQNPYLLEFGLLTAFLGSVTFVVLWVSARMNEGPEVPTETTT